MVLYLFRHGESAANVTHTFASRKLDLPLTEFGLEQVRQIVKPMSEIRFTKIYTSPLIRAMQTAESIGNTCGLKPIVFEELREVDVGELDAKCIEEQEQRAIYDNIIIKWDKGKNDIGFKGGETLNDIKKRIDVFLKTIDYHNDKKILVIGHGLYFMAFIWLFCNSHGPTFHDGRINRCHYSIIEKNNKQYHLVSHDIAPENSKKGKY
jgi:broad specificity phosphatase PhoE